MGYSSNQAPPIGEIWAPGQSLLLWAPSTTTARQEVIDVATVAIGQRTCNSFVIPISKKKDLLERISRLPQASLYGNVTRLGFGLRHVLEDFCDTDEGLACIALCGCLTSSYDALSAAPVLRCLCTLQKAPSDVIPGTKRWITVLEVCSGIWAGTQFHSYVNGLSRILWPPQANGEVEVGATDPNALVEAILALGMLSNGRVESCTFTGGIDCAWLASVAQFMFDLSV